ncbi:Na+/H+ antiporter subunit E [Kurthia sibirica]|uniref:Na+/H+ antiporter subunit E n=1 Tax=Kurthia sibirica TaxID=202750 RepID=A0A2U3AHY0_9BACL|nr:Na+/H+ antiporter subunit E [Kurthia sibirica]PWI24162.1 Na+/H+ antiporter subunit E [Kurthia sibirica]GEK34686.1 Na(+)/H(+) antiporter subunit E [Kurthia sibirica]
MAIQILLNFFIALIWMFLSINFTGQGLIIGYLLGLVMLYIMRNMFTSRFYLHRLWAVIKLTCLFFKELWLANIAVVKIALATKNTMEPAFFEYPTVLEKDWEVTLLSSLITLTPGTIVVHVSDDSKLLYIHAIDIDDVDATIRSIKDSFEEAILEVSRS